MVPCGLPAAGGQQSLVNAVIVIRTRRRRVVLGPLRPRLAAGTAEALRRTIDALGIEATVDSQNLVSHRHASEVLTRLARARRNERPKSH